MPIPSRLAGMGKSAETWLPLIFGAKANPAEQRAAERHQAWRENLAAVRAQAAQEAQMQRGAMQQLQGNLGPTLAMMKGTPGETMVPYQIANPDGTPQKQEMWDMGLDYGDTMKERPSSVINQERLMTDIDKYRARDLWNKAHGLNMSGASAFAKALGAGDTPDEWVETPYNALASQGGLGYAKDQRAGYAEQGSQSIADAITKATGAEYGPNNLGGVMAGGSDVIAQQYKDNLMQDVWAVATKLAHGSNLIDANTAFHQIMQAMATGKIDPIQIQQTANIKDGWFTDEQELAIKPLDKDFTRDDRLARLAQAYAYLDQDAAEQGVKPVMRPQQ
jgi:hypothetical protein